MRHAAQAFLPPQALQLSLNEIRRSSVGGLRKKYGHDAGERRIKAPGPSSKRLGPLAVARPTKDEGVHREGHEEQRHHRH